MRILLDTPKYFYSHNNTDWKLKQYFAGEFKTMGMFVPNGILWNLFCNIAPIIARFFRGGNAEKIWCIASRVRACLARKYHPDWIVSQGIDPVVTKGAKTIWETYFLDDPEIIADLSQFCRGGKDIWIRQMEKYGGAVSIIGVRGEYSVELAKRMYPEYASKVRNLGFVRPEFDIVNETVVHAKQAKSGRVSILFVGRQARLKGLEPLLAACNLLYDSGQKNFHLTVVSNLANSPGLVIPQKAWLTWYKSLPHDRVMDLMRDSQVFIMPSRADSYGMVYLEAMANGCVTMVRDAEPQREFVDYGNAGICVSYKRVEDIAEKLRLVISSSDLRDKLAIAGLRRYVSRYSQNVIRATWSECFGR